MEPVSTEIRFMLGARLLWSARRRLVPVGWSLSQILADADVPAAPLPEAADGYRLQSMPAAKLDQLRRRFPRLLASKPQIYPRHYIDMGLGEDGYMAQFSSKTRATLARKSRKLAEAGGGKLDIRSYHRPDDMEAFFAIAAPLAERTYQARLLNAALPDDSAFRNTAVSLAMADNLRAYILYLDGAPIAYLYLPIVDNVLVYAYLGYDQAHAHLSPGTVLQMEALKALFAERRFRYFDFTEGDGPHKSLFGTDQVSCATVFLLKPGVANRLLLLGHAVFNAAVALAGGALQRIGVKSLITKLLRPR